MTQTQEQSPAGSPASRKFRFAFSCNRLPEDLKDWRQTVEKADALGFSTILTGDHLGEPRYAPVPAMAAASNWSSRLRFGTIVFNNDFRHPAILAKDVATLDIMTQGRYDLGIGAGWMTGDYTMTGIQKDPGPTRVERLEEAVKIMKGLFGPDPVTFHGKHYKITNLPGWPKPIQQPHPPIIIGGGSREIVSLAAREADIVSMNPVHRRGTRGRGPELTVAAMAERAGWVKEFAGERYPQLEAHLLVFHIDITDNARAAAAAVSEQFGLTPDEVLTSPYLLVGSKAKALEDMERLRELYGISYFSIRHALVDNFLPVLQEAIGR